MYIRKLHDIINEYNNTYYRSIKIKPVDVKSRTYFGFCLKKIEKDSKFKIGDHIRISTYKSFLQNAMFQIGQIGRSFCK